MIPKPDLYQRAAEMILAIEAEMQHSGYWSDEPLPAEDYRFSLAFAMDTMAFSQWLQFIFIPRVRNIIEERGEFPSRSMVGAQAVRELDADPRSERLVALLNEFDNLFRS